MDTKSGKKPRKTKSDYWNHLLIVGGILKARPEATNQQIAEWGNMSLPTAARCASALRKKFEIHAKPGRRHAPPPPERSEPIEIVVWRGGCEERAFSFELTRRECNHLLKLLKAAGGREVQVR